MGADTGVCDTPGQLGRSIHLAPGVYSMGVRDLEQKVSLYGTSQEETVIEGTILGLQTDAVLANLTVTGGTSGGIVVARDQSPEITACTITANAGFNGAGVRCHSGSSPTLTNCLIWGNEGTRGGGLFCTRASPNLLNCTIAANSASFGSGLYFQGSSSPTVRNCIVWSRDGEAIWASSSSTAVVTYSCIAGAATWPGEGNLNEDPMFVDDGDYHLQPSSPAIDRGNSEGAPLSDTEALERPCQGGVDMGAYEFCDETAPGAQFRRGDCNNDAKVDISDAINTLDALFLGDEPLGCQDACDVNDDGQLDISDPIATLDALFLGSGSIPLPGMQDCGVDPTADGLGCELYEGCP